jgi:hypothetical protein
MVWFMAICAGDVVASDVNYIVYSIMLYVYCVWYFLHVGYDLNDFTCLRSACIVDIERLEIGAVGLPKVCNEGIRISLGMSGGTLPSTTRLDTIMYGLHGINVSLMLIPPGAHISCT